MRIFIISGKTLHDVKQERLAKRLAKFDMYIEQFDLLMKVGYSLNYLHRLALGHPFIRHMHRVEPSLAYGHHLRAGGKPAHTRHIARGVTSGIPGMYTHCIVSVVGQHNVTQWHRHRVDIDHRART